MTLRVLEPTLAPEGGPLAMAPALATLEGSVVGMIDNSKIGTERFFDHVADMLKRDYGVREVLRRRKPDMTRPVPPDMLASLKGADAILSAIGD
jgi:hypothetical protein